MKMSGNRSNCTRKRSAARKFVLDGLTNILPSRLEFVNETIRRELPALTSGCHGTNASVIRISNDARQRRAMQVTAAGRERQIRKSSCGLRWKETSQDQLLKTRESTPVVRGIVHISATQSGDASLHTSIRIGTPGRSKQTWTSKSRVGKRRPRNIHRRDWG